MKNLKLKLLIFLFACLKTYSQTACDGIVMVANNDFQLCNTNPWVKVFEENFNGTNLDLSKWKIQSSPQGALYGRNQNQEFNTINNLVVSNGILRIIAKKETLQKRAFEWKADDEILSDGLPNLRLYNFTSSSIWTLSKFGYGKFEARVKLPKGKGFWPAFWTYSGSPWNEIDIFEFWNEKDVWGNFDSSKLSKIHNMTVHYDYDNDKNDNMCLIDYAGVDYSQDFHVFAVVWEKNKIEWYVDGVLKRRDYQYYYINGGEIGCSLQKGIQYVFNQIFPRDPMNVILNFAIQNGNEAPDNSTVFPSQMEVDWVRYYQRNPCRDISISDPTQFVLDNTNYNVLVGNNITINCNYIVQSSQQLEIVAKSNIFLGANFKADLGSVLNLRMESLVCE